ncbi:glutamine synthetase III [Clostridium sp. 'deep sea']|uniref:glutamine synthetase III family protein n=1 Tax=Clostridium sp. 'deep sea' TaxID=2779445 RepID=UPI0018966C0E|nr:glutamine synthetase III [Clostridium sp. 'deep sea']QOR35614.1 glutamine synthetase III [Clostridium sp. 'deep sea']
MTYKVNLENIFEINVFSDSVMKARLPKNIYRSYRQTIDNGIALDSHVADVIATVMKDWAIERGATHYCHWFQPMTGLTAQKHEAFLTPTQDGILAQFSGKELIKGEPDASSFPNGGIRSTFEARGYTAWDCTSPAFVKEGILCIPTAFCSYYGHALDKKTPLLKSMESLSTEAVRIVKLFGNDSAKKVIPTVGAEQEYFLVDKKHYNERPDLIYTGRTLFGAMPPKGQELDDHYFATIKERIHNFMFELDQELWKLGVAVKTEHNEVALGQFELAPLFSTTNVATDQNQLVMDVLDRVANRHDLVCLLHEKPFARMNGSGKHVNWSLSCDGDNILEPGDNPQNNLRFLLFLSAIIKAVDKYPELLRFAASTPGNDYRLGAAEAPPAVISIFLGQHLTDILAKFASGVDVDNTEKNVLKLGVTTIPEFEHDTTDRNRTSPFAFTANRFEFRMVASSMSIAGPCTVLNTIVSGILADFADRLENCHNLEAEVIKIIGEVYNEHGRVIFNGDGYSEDWKLEAERRGLPCINSFIESVPHLIAEKSLQLFEKMNVLSADELESRYEIHVENYIKKTRIEALTMCDLTTRYIIPAIDEYLFQLGAVYQKLSDVGTQSYLTIQKNKIEIICKYYSKLTENCDRISSLLSESTCKNDYYAEGEFLRYSVVPEMEKLREIVDTLEKMVDKKVWPWPGYDDILFAL